MKKLMLLLAALVLGAALTGCGAPGPKVDAKATVQATLDAYKSGDLNKFAGFFSGKYNNELSDENLAKNLGIDSDIVARLMDTYSKNADVTIKSVKETDKGATASIEVSTVDLMGLMDKESGDLTKEATKNPQKFLAMSQDEVTKAVFDKVISDIPSAKKTDPKTITTKLIIDDSGDEPVWKINDDSLVNALFSGME